MKLYYVIATDKLYIAELTALFKPGVQLSTGDITAFYRTFEPDLKQGAINWRAYMLVQKGMLRRTGRGRFELGRAKVYAPELQPGMKALTNRIQKEFPYLKACIWDTSALNEFMLHQPGQFYLLVETEKEAMPVVFYFLKSIKHPVFIDPSAEVLERYMPDNKRAIIVKHLVTEAPVQRIKGFYTTTLEKMLVDIFCDPVIFAAQQGAEMKTIFKEALVKYTVNQNRMLRYAGRRRKKALLLAYLDAIKDIGP